MEITILLLLTVALSVASPLRPAHRSDTDTVQASGVKRSADPQEEHAPVLKIIPFHSEDKQLDLDALKHRVAVELRPRRALPSGCQFGTCQLHNLANTLYNLSKTRGKEDSKMASDPHGYGR
uniref:ProAM N-terminal 20 peptide n=1 Tax=Mastacembelus armatus TaxID=205130 RepID=A0A3Q3LU29_9TELE